VVGSSWIARIIIYLGSSPLLVDLSTGDEITQVSVDHLSTDRDDEVKGVCSNGKIVLDIMEDGRFGSGGVGHGIIVYDK